MTFLLNIQKRSEDYFMYKNIDFFYLEDFSSDMYPQMHKKFDLFLKNIKKLDQFFFKIEENK